MSDNERRAQWLAEGIENGWAGPAVCSTHDGTPITAAEEDEFNEGYDPCVFIIRPYHDAAERAAVEANHSPSTWRAR